MESAASLPSLLGPGRQREGAPLPPGRRPGHDALAPAGAGALALECHSKRQPALSITRRVVSPGNPTWEKRDESVDRRCCGLRDRDEGRGVDLDFGEGRGEE
eukprot:4252852-Pyramimonas_sp.AAC.1